jgi:hypothetical protein
MRCFFGVALSLTMFAVAVPASAGELLHSFCISAKRVNCWPEPFYRADRASVGAPLQMMVAKGWKLQTTVDEVHFESGSAELNQAGRMKVMWIVSSAPEQHRTVYVHRMTNPQATAQRVDSVQQYVVKLLPKGQLPQVLETDNAVRKHRAEYIDDVYRRFRDSTPQPRLEGGTALSSEDGG